MQERLHFLHLYSGDAAAAHCVTTSVALEAERPVGDDGWRPSTPTTAQSQTSELAQWIVSEVEAHTICIVQHLVPAHGEKTTDGNSQWTCAAEWRNRNGCEHHWR